MASASSHLQYGLYELKFFRIYKKKLSRKKESNNNNNTEEILKLKVFVFLILVEYLLKSHFTSLSLIDSILFMRADKDIFTP